MEISGNYARRIKSWVTSLLAVHTAVADAHHSKYTDAEVDVIVATHTAIAAAHQTIPTGHGFHAQRNDAQSIPDATATAILYNTELFDTDNDYSSATGHYTPSNAGYYAVHAGVVIQNLGDGKKFIVRLEKNANIIALDRGTVGGTDFAGGVASCIIYMNGVADYLRCRFYHNNGSALDTAATSGNTSFSAWMLPPP